MKKVRLNLKRGKKSWSFTLYDSVESAYYLKDEPVMDDDIEEYRRIVTMRRGESIEAEWLGAEWIYDEDDAVGDRDPKGYKKFDRVRLGKISPLKNTATGANYLELYSGWVINNEFPWIPDDTRDDVRITRINGRSVSRLDFSKLFVRYSDESGDKDGMDPGELEPEEEHRFSN